ncbi:hypothetical protein GCM10009828_086660 [Actinoplanes couchii]|uniref:Uncharacterized protein n=1 Tax=Actinoplanes couchii TaxID=403638 RepID=A0ABQ3XEV5_9ACTN|nr:hypothetical protein Aco03nite_054440 [Actinoplanes couchii]
MLIEDLLQWTAHRDDSGTLVERQEQPLVGEAARTVLASIRTALCGLRLFHPLLYVNGGHLVPTVTQETARRPVGGYLDVLEQPPHVVAKWPSAPSGPLPSGPDRSRSDPALAQCDHSGAEGENTDEHGQNAGELVGALETETGEGDGKAADEECGKGEDTGNDESSEQRRSHHVIVPSVKPIGVNRSVR